LRWILTQVSGIPAPAQFARDRQGHGRSRPPTAACSRAGTAARLRRL